MYKTIFEAKFNVPHNLMFGIPYVDKSRACYGTNRFFIMGIDNNLVLTEQEKQDITKHFKAILDIVRK